MIRRGKGSSLLSYFLKVFLLIIVIPVFCINLMLNYRYKDVLIDNYSEKVMQIMAQMAMGYEDEQKRIALVAAQMANDAQLLNLYTRWHQEEDSAESFNLSREIDSKIKYMLNYGDNVETLVVYFKDGSFYYFGNPPFKPYEEVRQYDWYGRIQLQEGTVYRIGMTEGITWSFSDIKKMAVAVKPVSMRNNDDIEAIYLEFSTNVFNSLYSDFNSENLGNLYFVDRAGNVLVSSDPSFTMADAAKRQTIRSICRLRDDIVVRKLEGTGTYFSAYYLKKSGNMMINLVNEDRLTQDINGVLRLFNWAYLVIVVLFILFTILYFRELITPIHRLMHKMKSAQKGNFDDVIEVDKGPSEVRQLGASYNGMLVEIKALMQERDMKEHQRSEEEMRALQAQINPHFVYNTLNTIRLMAMMSKAEGIKNMVDAFMKILSKTFKDVGRRVQIEDELDYIKNYIYIMEIRYGNGIRLILEVPEEIRQLAILNMLLQPIVENSILHGFSSPQEDYQIRIRGFMDGEDLALEIWDNGCGIPAQDISRLLEHDSHSGKGFNHMGLGNVDKRIKLNFGAVYGLNIESQPGISTTVTIRLPKLEMEWDLEMEEGERDHV